MQGDCVVFYLMILVCLGIRTRLKSTGTRAALRAASGGAGARASIAVQCYKYVTSKPSFIFNSPLRDFTGDCKIQSGLAKPPLPGLLLNRVNVYDLQFAHCAQCVLHGIPCAISGSRGASAVAVVRAALKLGVGQRHVLS
jgi:hypothetical protein